MASESEAIQLPRLIVPGDKIIPKGRRTPEVVRSVSIVIHAADGMDYVYADDDEVRMAPADVVTPSMEDIKAAHEREIEMADKAIDEARTRLEELTVRERELEDLRAQLIERESRINEEERAISEQHASVKGE
jgi:hypothetical protein